MTSIVTAPLKINGVISTDKSVLENLTSIADAGGCWLTFDVAQGLWAIVLNSPASALSYYDFDDSNILGSITVSETGVKDLYNAVSIEFPHSDLRDQSDYVDLEIDSGDRYTNEVDNRLNIQNDLINDPVQAQYLAGVELKQNRLNKIVTFNADYTKIAFKAGRLFKLTSEMYGFTDKLFRIVKVEEVDEDGLVVKITGLEYDADVYDTADLVRKERTKATGILLKEQNETLRTSDDIDTGNQMARLLAANAGAYLLRSLFKRITGTDSFGPTEQAAQDIDKLLSNAKRPSLTTISGPTHVCEGDDISITAGHSCTSCLFDIPGFDYDWEITGLLEEDITAITVNGIALSTVSLTGTIPISSSGTIVITTAATAGSTLSQTMSITIGGVSTSVDIYDMPDFTYSTVASTSSITEGDSVTFTVNTTNVANGTIVPYTISGSASDLVTSPALTGNITINSNTASVIVNTNDDSTYTGTQGLTFAISPTLPINPCGSWDLSESISVLDNDPAPTPDVHCEYVLVPAVWCGHFDATTTYLKSVSVLKSVYLPKAPVGGAAVPTSVSVSNPGTSSAAIVIGSTVNVDTVTGVGGAKIDIITSFDPPPSGGDTLLTGTTSTYNGYW